MVESEAPRPWSAVAERSGDTALDVSSSWSSGDSPGMKQTIIDRRYKASVVVALCERRFHRRGLLVIHPA